MNTLKAKLALWLAAASTLVLTAPGRPAETAGPTTLDLRPESALARAVQPFVESNTLAGAVMLVASKDKVLGLDAVGWADIAARKPMATDTLFWIASQSKPMTAAAFMMLAGDGMCMATPALAGDRLLIRTAARLYCIRAKEQARH